MGVATHHMLGSWLETLHSHLCSFAPFSKMCRLRRPRSTEDGLLSLRRRRRLTSGASTRPACQERDDSFASTAHEFVSHEGRGSRRQHEQRDASAERCRTAGSAGGWSDGERPPCMRSQMIVCQRSRPNLPAAEAAIAAVALSRSRNRTRRACTSRAGDLDFILEHGASALAR